MHPSRFILFQFALEFRNTTYYLLTSYNLIVLSSYYLYILPILIHATKDKNSNYSQCPYVSLTVET